MVEPAPGKTPIINPMIEDLGIVVTIFFVSSLSNLIDPSLDNDICFAA